MNVSSEIRVNLQEDVAFPCLLDAGMVYPMSMGGRALEME
jgi:hypothetical protein